ncbi:MAG: type IV pili methyl-accepting chemotaxis transducer N-terminal domain-containing protein [Bdellovibrionales bacterium]|nr:type IV pili methyl-accepting chemotaxis transducer N-terminal domain-containing protein [Bdellovibrionales bacterium]
MESSLVRSLRFRYRLGLSLIALLATTAYLLSSTVIRNHQASAKIINDSGRQRMLSQRIGLLALSFTSIDLSSYDKSLSLRELDDALALLINTHAELSSPVSVGHSLSPTLQKLYFAPLVGVETMMRDFQEKVARLRELVRDGTSRNDESLQIQGWKVAEFAKNKMLPALDRVVLQYQYESEQEVSGLQRLELVVFLVTLLLLTLELRFIFYPMNVALKTFLSALQVSSGILGSHRSRARLINQSGRQRMLAQRIGMLALEVTKQSVDRAGLLRSLEELQQAQAELMSSHIDILSQSTASGVDATSRINPQLVELFFDEKVGVDSLLKKFSKCVDEFVLVAEDFGKRNEMDWADDAARRLFEKASDIALLSRTRVLSALDKLVLYFQREIEIPRSVTYVSPSNEAGK